MIHSSDDRQVSALGFISFLSFSLCYIISYVECSLWGGGNGLVDEKEENDVTSLWPLRKLGWTFFVDLMNNWIKRLIH